jgi:hypothetical protein
MLEGGGEEYSPNKPARKTFCLAENVLSVDNAVKVRSPVLMEG